MNPNFPALQLLHDPQTFGERLYDSLNRYGTRLLVLAPNISVQSARQTSGFH